MPGPAGGRARGRRGDAARPEVLLVSVPFAPLLFPSIALGLLQAGLARAGIGARSLYLGLRYGERIGLPLYERIALGRAPADGALAGEWVFSAAVFGDAEDATGYVEEVLLAPGLGRRRASAAFCRRLRGLRRDAAAVLDAWADEVARLAPRVVGFTSVFHQHLAALGLARRVKERLPGAAVVLGGANCEGAMGRETLRSFPWVDAVVPGEGDLVLPALARALLDGRAAREVPGVLARGPDGAPAPDPRPGARVADLDLLPEPDYADFFADLARTRFGRSWLPGVPLETARGCWWGERVHCTFCGLNGEGMAFRAKSPERALGEIRRAARRHRGCPLVLVDNILDLGYLDTLLPRLAAERLGVQLFWETKSNLRKEQVRALRAAGVDLIQPGIESLSDAVLRLMGKGVTALANVQLLKWCLELGVRPLWNLLWGFPGEQALEYARMTALLPLLSHLEPPVAAPRVRLDRFSPNHARAAEMGFTAVAPFPAYRHVYPGLAPAAVENLAYHFTAAHADGRDPAAWGRPLGAAAARWRRAHARSFLFVVEREGEDWVCDLRPLAGAPRCTRLAGPDRRLHRLCDSVRRIDELAALLAADGEGALPTREVEGRAARLVERGLLLRDGGRLLALAVPLPARVPRAAVGRLRRLLGARLRPGAPEPEAAGGPAPVRGEAGPLPL